MLQNMDISEAGSVPGHATKWQLVFPIHRELVCQGKTPPKTGQLNRENSQPLSAMAFLAAISFLHLSGSFLYGLRNSLRV